MLLFLVAALFLPFLLPTTTSLQSLVDVSILLLLLSFLLLSKLTFDNSERGDGGGDFVVDLKSAEVLADVFEVVFVEVQEESNLEFDNTEWMNVVATAATIEVVLPKEIVDVDDKTVVVVVGIIVGVFVVVVVVEIFVGAFVVIVVVVVVVKVVVGIEVCFLVLKSLILRAEMVSISM